MSDVYLFNKNSGITKNVMTDIEYDGNKKPFYNLTLYAATKDENEDKWYKGRMGNAYFLWDKHQCRSRAYGENDNNEVGNKNIKDKCGNIIKKIEKGNGFYQEIEELGGGFQMDVLKNNKKHNFIRIEDNNTGIIYFIKLDLQIPKNNHIVDSDDDEPKLGYGKNKHTSADRFKAHILKNINEMIKEKKTEMDNFFENPKAAEAAQAGNGGGRRRRRKSRKKRKSKRKSRRKSKRKSKRKRKTKKRRKRR